MEKLEITANQLQQTNNSSISSKITFVKKENNFEISVYKGELTPKFLAQSVVKVRQAFPALPPDFFIIFSDRLKANRFCDERLNDAVTHVIDNCIYPTPTIAQFISFDKIMKVYTYDQYLKLVNELGVKTGDLYKSVRFPNAKKPAWVHVNDIEKYKLILWNLK